MAYVGTELEFIVFNQSYEEAWRLGYDNLTPANLYNVDYSIIGTSRVERLRRRIRNEMSGAGMYVESAKGECNLGQNEVTFRYSDAITTCDNHVIYKTGAKEIADQEGMTLTFMPKWDQREGNSCHIHISLRSVAGEPVMAGDGEHGFSPLMGQPVIDHYLNAARVEQEAFDAAVTDWERSRGLSASEPPAPLRPLIGLSTYVEDARHGAWDELRALLPYS